MSEHEAINGGIYDAFPGYRLPSDDEIDAALQSALVVVDANVLLNLYRYNESTRDDLLGILSRLGNRLWTPHQVMREFWRNRLSVLASRDTAASQALDALAKQHRATEAALLQWAKATAIDISAHDALLEKVGQLHNDLEAAIQSHAPASLDIGAGARAEPVLLRLEQLLQGKVGSALDPAEWQEAVNEGNRRATNKEPPGYLDVDKVNSDLLEKAAGDYLVWRQTINEASRRSMDVLFVTGDEKEDWWWRYRSELLGPRSELVAELQTRCGRQLYMMRPIDLLKRASALEVTVRVESVEDVARVSRESEEHPAWTEAGVAALLEALEIEGREQADIIRAAAQLGGTVDRDVIYAIGEYDDDRMLRGFTRPTARITRDLQAAGLVANGVNAALTPIYRGGVKAVAFRIPSEMVSILGGDEPLHGQD